MVCYSLLQVCLTHFLTNMGRLKVESLQSIFGQRLQEAIKAIQQSNKLPDTPNAAWCASWLDRKLINMFPEDPRSAPRNNGQRTKKWPVKNWIYGKNIPEIAELLAISHIVNKPINWLLGEELTTQTEFEPSSKPSMINFHSPELYKLQRRNIIKSTKRVLWIQLRTAYYLQDYADVLAEVMQRDVKVRIIICDPNDPLTMATLARRKYKLHSTAQNSGDMIHSVIENVKRHLRWEGISEERLKNLLKIRVISFFPATAIYLTDHYGDLTSDNDNGNLFAVTPVYKLEPDCAPITIANRIDHKELFAVYRKQFAALWHDAREYSGRVSKETMKDNIQKLNDYLMDDLEVNFPSIPP